MTTNMQVIQTSVLIKYRVLYEFLQNQAGDVAKEIQRAYIAASRVYYETGFRRYIRSLGWVKVHSVIEFHKWKQIPEEGYLLGPDSRKV